MAGRVMGSKKPGKRGDWKVIEQWELITLPRLLQARSYTRYQDVLTPLGKGKMGQKQKNIAL